MNERDIATKVLNTYWDGKPIPVNPALLAEAAGVSVRACSNAELGGASGWYRQPDGKPVILFNASEPTTRQRFTIAHELGHHVLQHGERPRDNSSAFMNPYEAVEVSANRFAAEVLMPVHAVRVMVEERQVTSITELANAFCVSEPAMIYRLKNLGYIS